MIGIPTEDHNEYLPPIFSENGKILNSLNPHSIAFVTEDVMAIIFSLIDLFASKSQLFAKLAFVIVSKVLKLLEVIMNNVFNGLHSLRIS